MKGFPKHLNTAADYDYIKEHFPVEQVQPHFQALLDSRLAWLPVKTLGKGEAGKTNATNRVVEVKDEQNVVTALIQEELKEDPNALIKRLGLTVEDVAKSLEGKEKRD